jgi:hypothetical protein
VAALLEVAREQDEPDVDPVPDDDRPEEGGVRVEVPDHELRDAERCERAAEERDPDRGDRLPGAVVDGDGRGDREDDEERRPDEVLRERVVLHHGRGDVPAVAHLERWRVLLRIELLHGLPDELVERGHIAVVAGRRPEPDDHREDRHLLARLARDGHVTHSVAVAEAAEQLLPLAAEARDEPLHVRRGAGGGPLAARPFPRDARGEHVAEPLELGLVREEQEARPVEVGDLVDPVLHPADELLRRSLQPLGQSSANSCIVSESAPDRITVCSANPPTRSVTCSRSTALLLVVGSSSAMSGRRSV